METKTKIILGIGAVAVLGTSVFLIARHLKKKKSADILPEKTDSNAFDEETPSPYAPQPTPQPTATNTTSKASTTTASKPVTEGINVQINGSTFSISYTYDKSAKTISISAMGVSSSRVFKLSNVKKTQQYIMNYNSTLKTEMNKCGGADGKFGAGTAKCFAIMVCMMSQSEDGKKKLSEAMSSLGITETNK